MLLFLPYLISGFLFQESFHYEWKEYGLSFIIPLNLSDESIDEYGVWELNDEQMDYWFTCERYTFDEEKSFVYSGDSKSGLKALNDDKAIENTEEGGEIPGVKDGYYFTLNRNGIFTYLALIIDRKNQVVYEIIIDDEKNNRIASMQLINSLSLKD